ncbi:FMN-linked oxidoreductase [Violaceomyces palustris]|uniref:FMN-linked oxidoreductase n=1 Tax=Violaceomyces palustris TaxID=1673888 RepID=A0ACD0P010_9BASI|nr:FMN-linked oxidoreductase [Violaceomyces palustris]
MAGPEILNKPVEFRSGLKAPNPTLKSAMTERLCTWSDDPSEFNKRGWPTEAYINLYKAWGKGEIGTIVLGNIPCDARYPEAKRNACIDYTIAGKDDYVKAYRPVMEASKANGSIVIAQVTHAGRQTSEEIVDVPVSASDVQCAPAMGMKFGKPRPLTVEEIKDIVKRFAFAAEVLYEAGADGIQLHAAHGYLLSQFLSPRINKRTDAYGGDLDGRSRIIFEIISAIRQAVPDERFIIAIKVNSADFAEGGFDGDDSMEMAKRLERAGVELIELSGGTYESRAFEHKKESTIKRESFFIEFADRIRPHLTTAKLAVTGGFRSSSAMAQAIAERSCDIVGMARPLTGEPELVKALLEAKSQRAIETHPSLPAELAIPACVFQMSQLGRNEPVSNVGTEQGVQEDRSEGGSEEMDEK